jgi:prepilin-type N-terminal cleavage/methylation domain-containing protein
MKKQGFTLIELMVVIVIMGILAAVAVPKLFGMIAKSKASEVGPAAGTYVKLQQAYISETVNMGNWEIIGYKGPGTNTKGANDTKGGTSQNNNFNYGDGGTYVNNSAALDDTGKIGFWAHNRVKLNDCNGADAAPTSGWNWTVTVKTGGGSSEGDAQFVAATNCAELTSNFSMIGK